MEQLTAEDVMADSAMFYEDRHHNARLRALHRELTRCKWRGGIKCDYNQKQVFSRSDFYGFLVLFGSVLFEVMSD